MAKKPVTHKLIRQKSSYLWKCGISLVLVMILSFFGTGDTESINLYINKLQTLSEHELHANQIDMVKYFYLSNENKHPQKSNQKSVRSAFNAKRPSLRKQWTAHYNMVWPKLIISRNSQVMYECFQAHHIIPINAGGINKWWNITPLTPSAHNALHNSLEEKACFSHNPIELHCYRFLLRIQHIVANLIYNKKYPNPSVIKIYKENFLIKYLPSLCQKDNL